MTVVICCLGANAWRGFGQEKGEIREDLKLIHEGQILNYTDNKGCIVFDYLEGMRLSY